MIILHRTQLRYALPGKLFSCNAIQLVPRLAIVLLLTTLIPHANVFAQSTVIRLPYIAVPKAPCSTHVEVQSLFKQIEEHPDQQRTTLECHSILMDVAQARATDLATRNYFEHVTPEGFGPNYLVVEAGYPLSSSYNRSQTANTIESLTAGTNASTAHQALAYFLGSSHHRNHLLGETPLYLEQIDIGIGYATDPNSTYKHYWVVLIAAPQG